MRSAVDADIASLPCIERCSVTRYGLRHQRPAVDPDLRGAHDRQRDHVGHPAAAGQAAQPPYSVTPHSSRISGSTTRPPFRTHSCPPTYQASLWTASFPSCFSPVLYFPPSPPFF